MTAIRSLRRTLALAFLALAPIATPAARADYQDRYTAGHVDINLVYDPATNALELNYELTGNTVLNGSAIGTGREVGANSVTVVVGDNGLGVGAAGLPSPFAGAPLWTIPQGSRAGRPFLGIGAEEIEPGVFRNDTLTLTLTGIAARPAGGQFVLYQGGDEGTPLINTANGLSIADALPVVSLGHDHYVFGFTAAGVYDLVFTASGRLNDANGTLLTATETYRFAVGTSAVPEPGSIALLGLGIGAGALGLARRSRLAGVARA